MKYISWAILFAGAFLLFKIQFLTPTLWEADGYYHTQAARVVRTEGFVQKFHWARYSQFAERYSDKDLLYHILLAPLTFFKNDFLAVKYAAAFFAVVLLGVYFWILRRYCAEALIPAFLSFFFIAPLFLSALERPRPMVLGIAAMLFGIHNLLQRNARGVFASTLLYGYLHLTAPLMIVFALMTEGLRWLESSPSSTEKKFEPRLIGAAFWGLLASYLIHPNFPKNIYYVWLNLILVPYYAAKGGVLELGGEFFPLSTRDFLLGYPFLFVGIFLVILISAVRPAKIRFETKAVFLCAAPFLLGALTSQRYMIHGYLLFLWWLAMHLSDQLTVDKGVVLPQRLRVAAWTGGGGLVALWLFCVWFTKVNIVNMAYGERVVNSHYETVGNWMKQNLPPGEPIFHANWSDSQYFIGINPNNDYFVTMDPIYMYSWNRDVYLLYREVAHARSPDLYTPLKEVFKVRFGYANRNYFSPFIERISSDPRFRILAQDGQGVVFQLL